MPDVLLYHVDNDRMAICQVEDMLDNVKQSNYKPVMNSDEIFNDLEGESPSKYMYKVVETDDDGNNLTVTVNGRDSFGVNRDYEIDAIRVVEMLNKDSDTKVEDGTPIANFVDDRALKALEEIGVTTAEEFIKMPEQVIAGKVPFITKKTYPGIIAEIKKAFDKADDRAEDKD